MTDVEEMRDAFFDEVLQIAAGDSRVVVLTADHGAFALSKFESQFPERFINVGIAEQNMISMGAGLASTGKRPILYGIAPFMSLRVLEQITLDLAAMSLPVTIASVGAGFTYSTDGSSHLGLQDTAAVMTVPNLEVLNSSDPASTRLFAASTVTAIGPRYVRIEKGELPVLQRKEPDWLFEGCATVREGTSDLVLVSTGAVVHEVIRASEEIQLALGVSPTVVDVHRIKPFPGGRVTELLAGAKHVIAIEESYDALSIQLGMHILRSEVAPKFSSITVQERYFFEGSSRNHMLTLAGLSSDQIAARVSRVWSEGAR